MPFDPEDNFIPADPAQWPRVGGVLRIVVHPKPPPGNPASDVPGAAFDDGPDDWFVPPSSAAPNAWPAAQPAASTGGFTPPPGWPDPWAAFWSRIPASSAGAMAWQPPIFLGHPPNLPPAGLAPAWPPALTSPAGFPNISSTAGMPGGFADPRVPGSAVPLGGMFDSLAKLGTPGPAIPLGGMFDSLAELGSSAPNPGGAFPSTPPQFANAQAGPLPARRPIGDYSTGEILADGGKSFGVGVGRFGIQGAGLLGDVRESIANGAQRAADYFAPGSAPNAGAKVSDFLASYPMLAGPTSSQLQSAVEQYTGPFYQPKTIIGDYAETAGEYVPGALLNPEGSLAANAVRYGLLPALTSETAGQLTQGTAAEPWARTLAAVLGAGPGAWHHLARTRSAPEVAEPLARRAPQVAEPLTRGGPDAAAPPPQSAPQVAESLAQGGPDAAAPPPQSAPQVAESLAQGGPEVAEPLAQSDLSPAGQLAARRRAQLEVNKAAGAAFEERTAAELSQREDIEFARQITVELPSGARARLDFVTRNRVTGEIKLIECKSSATARLTAEQKVAFREMKLHEATIVGEGKPGFPGGMKIPPTQVEIRRPRKLTS
jgi:hypothetical protein